MLSNISRDSLIFLHKMCLHGGSLPVVRKLVPLIYLCGCISKSNFFVVLQLRLFLLVYTNVMESANVPKNSGKICALPCKKISSSTIASLFCIMENDIFYKKITAEHS
jgi:hypothetical protein